LRNQPGTRTVTETMKKTPAIACLSAAVVVLGALAWLRLGSNGPSQPVIDEGRAATLALDFYAQQRSPADSLSSVRIVSEKQITGSSGRAVWEVQISGGVTEPGSSFTYESAMILDVDVSSGSVTIVAQG
jgi:hypothetical protein